MTFLAHSEHYTSQSTIFSLIQQNTSAAGFTCRIRMCGGSACDGAADDEKGSYLKRSFGGEDGDESEEVRGKQSWYLQRIAHFGKSFRVLRRYDLSSAVF